MHLPDVPIKTVLVDHLVANVTFSLAISWRIRLLLGRSLGLFLSLQLARGPSNLTESSSREVKHVLLL